MAMQGKLDIFLAMQRLSVRRPIFHSEADLQHALAWELKKIHEDLDLRLEVPVFVDSRRMFVDIVVIRGAQKTFIELKYKTSAMNLVVDGEEYFLKQQGAGDQGLYDCVKDFSRLERFVEASPGSNGLAVLLTNDAHYWRENRGKETLDRAFRLNDGRRIAGTLEWATHAGAGSIRGREAPIVLRGEYEVAWREYSSPLGAGGTPFRYLATHFG